MKDKQNVPLDCHIPEYDFSLETPFFKEQLRKQFIQTVHCDEIALLADDDFLNLYAAGDGMISRQEKKAGDTQK